MTLRIVVSTLRFKNLAASDMTRMRMMLLTSADAFVPLKSFRMWYETKATIAISSMISATS